MKKIITFAAAAAMASPLAIATAAAGDLDIYGRAHLSVDHLDDRDDSSQFLSSNGSRLGIRGSEYLGMGLTGIFQYETQVNVTSGHGEDAEENTPGLFTTGRTSYLGLQGDFGTVLGGRLDDPLKTAMDATQLFGDRLGDAGNLAVTPANNTRHNNVLAYVTPEFEGFTGTFVYGPQSGQDKGDRFVIEGRYDNQIGEGNLFASLGYLQANEGVVDDVNLDDKHKVWQAVAAYSVADTWRVMAMYQDYGQSDLAAFEDDKMYGAGVGFHVAPQVELKGHVMHYDADQSDADTTIYAAGFDYYMTDRTTLYGVYAIANNDDNAAQRMDGYARGTGADPAVAADRAGTEGTAVAPGDNQWGLSVGIIHNF